MNYANLEKHICDTIKEGQIKIGYSEEVVRLYYPIESIAELLEIDTPSIIEMTEVLANFCQICEKRLGKIIISNKEERFCFMIPNEGTKYIHEIYKDNPFLRQFISQITRPGCKLEEIIAVFHGYSDDVYSEEHDELGHVIYFKDETIDEYVYCLKFDEFGATYHRFTKRDYEKLCS